MNHPSNNCVILKNMNCFNENDLPNWINQSIINLNLSINNSKKGTLFFSNREKNKKYRTKVLLTWCNHSGVIPQCDLYKIEKEERSYSRMEARTSILRRILTSPDPSSREIFHNIHSTDSNCSESSSDDIEDDDIFQNYCHKRNNGDNTSFQLISDNLVKENKYSNIINIKLNNIIQNFETINDVNSDIKLKCKQSDTVNMNYKKLKKNKNLALNRFNKKIIVRSQSDHLSLYNRLDLNPMLWNENSERIKMNHSKSLNELQERSFTMLIKNKFNESITFEPNDNYFN